VTNPNESSPAVTLEQLSVMRHAMGGSTNSQMGYRNYYWADPNDALNGLVEMKLMRRPEPEDKRLHEVTAEGMCFLGISEDRIKEILEDV